VSTEKEAAPAAAAAGTTSGLLDEIISASRLPLDEEGRNSMSQAFGHLLGALNASKERKRVDLGAIDDLIADIDRKMSAQVDAILHDETFQAVESTWRGLKFLVDRTSFDAGNMVEILDVTKQELMDDFEDAPTKRQTKLCRTVFEHAYATHGGVPYGVMLGNYHFSPSTPDIALLTSISNVAADAHTPFISSAGPQFFGMDSFEGLPDKANIDTSKLKKWESFRNSDNANYVGLTLPRFMLRSPYDPVENPIAGNIFDYREDVSDSHEHYLWGNTAFAFGTRLTESFAKYRWCPNIIGPSSGGQVDNLPVHEFTHMGAVETKPPTEVSVSEPRELELANEGFIPLTYRMGSDNAAFFSANSVQKPKFFGNTPEGLAAQTNFRLGTQMPYLFMVTRLAHHIKIYQREKIGSSMSKADMQSELNNWVRQYVSDQEAPSAEIKAKRPFRSIELKVSEVPGEAGWYGVQMSLRPHLKYMGSYFDLSLVGSFQPS
jgi:type VI secretion system protein ImpC